MEQEISEILDKFQIGDEDIRLVRQAKPKLMENLSDHVGRFYDWMQKHKEYKVYFAGNPNRLERVRKLQMTHWSTLFESNFDEAWFASRRHVGRVHADIDLPNDVYFAGMSMSGKSLVDQLLGEESTYHQARETASALTKMVFLDAYLVIDEISRIQREKISASSRALIEMSTPVTPIWEGILLLPLLGVLDSERAANVMSTTLNKISESRAKVFVLDISGVSAIDTAVANQLLKITQATRFMGCETLLSGLSPAIARTLVDLGVSVGDVRTTATLRDAFEMALRAVGAERTLTALQK